MPSTPAILWFRRDLRLGDNPALNAAVDHGGPVIPVYIWAPHEEHDWQPGAASRWWLHQSLEQLSGQLCKSASRLILCAGDTHEVLDSLIEQTGAKAVFWNRLYEPAIIQRDTLIKKNLADGGLKVESFNSHLLFEPWEVSTQQDTPYKVFTPFWRACRAQEDPAAPSAAPKTIQPPQSWPKTEDLKHLELEPKVDWAKGFRETWQPGERGGQSQLERFLNEAVADYATDRDRPDRIGTSRLSPHLHFGEISARKIWHATIDAMKHSKKKNAKQSAEVFLSELGWREFAHHLLYHFPHTTNEPLREEFTRFPWKEDMRALRAWQKGKTGFPIVDAGMRELWATGWMHNRVRMIVASFLVKDLMQPWQEGAKWFWDTLVDADLANNTLGWQWSAGCGADAAPYFRIFNPIKQGQRFDPDGDYVKKWIPELSDMAAKWIHEPWNAPNSARRKARIHLGKTYPNPIVDHSKARKRALEAYQSLK